MTTLVLSMIRGPAGVEKQTRYVSCDRFQIGRAPSSDWVLDDPHCIVSKRHCLFRQESDGWSIADMSRNGSFVARGAHVRRLGKEPYKLASGERLRLGSYEIAVELEEDEASFRILMPDGLHWAPLSPPPDVPPIIMTYRSEHPEPPSPEGATRPPHGAGTRADALADLLAGAALAYDDVRIRGREREMFRKAGAALRMMVGELRKLGLVLLDGPEWPPPSGSRLAVVPLLEARSDRDALRWLLDPDHVLDILDGGPSGTASRGSGAGETEGDAGHVRSS